MNKRSLIALSVAFLAIAGTTSNAFAQEKTRAEVRQELIQAENNGLHFVTDTSYPGVNPIFEQQAARLKHRLAKHHPAAQACVGPVDFCTPYFGS
jgi:hypothetical protein